MIWWCWHPTYLTVNNLENNTISQPAGCTTGVPNDQTEDKKTRTQDSVLCRSLYLEPNLYIQTVSLFKFLCKLYRLAAFSSVVVGRQLQILHCAKTQMQSSEHSGALLLSGHFNWCHVIWSVVWEWMLLNHGDVQVKECTGWFFFFPLMFLYM